MNKQKAFTLIELLIVIVIIGILATISTATFSGAVEDARHARAMAFWAQVKNKMNASPEGLVAHWDFEEGSGLAQDRSGNDHHMTSMSTLTHSADNTFHPNSSYAIESFGGNTYTSLTSLDDEFKTGSFTFSTWFYMQKLFPSSGLFQTAWPGGEGRVYLNGLSSGPKKYIRLGMTDSTSSVVYSGLEPFKLNTWHHVLATYDGDTNKIVVFVDGLFSSEAVVNNPPSEILRSPYFYFGRGLDGYMDDTHIWKEAFSLSD